MLRILSALAGLATAQLLCGETFHYQKPPKPILDALQAAPTPLISVSPQHQAAILMQPVRYEPIAEVAQPMLRLAGIRIDTKTNGMHLARTYTSYSGKNLSDASDIKIALPESVQLGAPVWSPDGKQFAFTNTTNDGIDLWIGDAATGKVKQLNGIAVNGVLPLGVSYRNPQEPLVWLSDNQTLLVRTVPAHRGAVPSESTVPEGPHVQESLGHAGPAPTYEDLLSNSHDEDLFDYYSTAQLVLVDASTGKSTPVGKPGVFAAAKPSPDGEHLLIESLHRPYSYQLPAAAFPQDIQVWSRSGEMEHRIAQLPLADRIPLAGVRTGPRSVEWLTNQPATLTWAEALDGGNPKEKAPNRDKLLTFAAPFQGEPSEVFKTQERFRGLQPLADGKALVDDYERTKRIVRTLEVDMKDASKPGKVIFSRNERDGYHDPGDPVMVLTPDGRRMVMQSGEGIYLSGEGASPAGDKPFLDRYNLDTRKADRLFQADTGYETVVAVLNGDGSRILTRRESPADPPNYFIHDGSDRKQLTNFGSPMPQAQGIKKQLVTYKRADGIPLSFTLYLPANYKEGTRLPAVLWAYPYEFSNAATAGQVTGHGARSFPELNYHQLVVLGGFALIDNAAMPIVGDPDTVNNTYVEQLRMDAQAAIDKAVELGVADRERIGVFGHSYGAFMTANLLAHTDLFHAGVAESGAYNRTLTPFGFQSERRTFWQAENVYTKMSPFWFADKIKTPLLLIHGEADDNTGTFPIQSERLYAAVRGNGGTVRLVMLPNEAHGYRGEETMQHVLFEELNWFNKYLKANDADAGAATDSGSSK